MWWTLFKGLVAGVVVAAVLELAPRVPRLGALVLTLPIVSIVAFIMLWTKEDDVTKISTLARETLVLVPLGLPFFVPLAFAKSWGLGFWPAFALGVVLATITIGLWFWLGPKP